MIKLDSKILLLLRDKLELQYDLESFLENKKDIDFSSHMIDMIKINYEKNRIEKVDINSKKQDIIFIRFIQKLYSLIEYFQKVENATVSINEILQEVNIDLVLTYKCVDKNLNINFDNYTWF